MLMMLALLGLLLSCAAIDAHDAHCVGASVGTAAADADDACGPEACVGMCGS